jgi:hypothetical protein
MDASNIITITCHEQRFDDGMPPDLCSQGKLHAVTEENAVRDFRAKAGTDRMTPNLVLAVYAKERCIRFYPCDWRDEAEKAQILHCLNMVFNDAKLRPDRYCFQGEVWVATADEWDGKTRASEMPNRMDGLSIITVEPDKDPIFSTWTRIPTEDGFLIEKHSDSRNERSIPIEGRLAELFAPLGDDRTVTHRVFMVPD